ncbi:MAG TPA: type IV pilus secretin PilQ, partial [Betaproteobacteria bacterium]|nr:type IV pilus secretin PilQ [Betaproteobacteria bacterium]
IDTKRVKTQIRVQNGETAVLGGIYEQNKRGDVTKVPFLGDIPVLGHLFRTDSRQDTKTELLVFLTPRIVRDDAGLR